MSAAEMSISPADLKRPVPGVVAEPLAEVREDLGKVESGRLHARSFVRQGYTDDCQHGVNVQINYYFNLHQIYASIAAYMARDSTALHGMAGFFCESAGESLSHALHLVDYQNMRGGKVMLKSIPMPDSEYCSDEKGDALYSVELALALEKLNFSKLRELHATARRDEDPELQDFVNAKLHEQVLSIKELGTYVSELRRVGKGHPVYHFDRRIQARHGRVLSAKTRLSL